MYKRIFDIEDKLDEAMFLFGARQTGKSTLLKERFKGKIYYDLLDPDVRKSFKRNPNSLKEALWDKPAGTLVIIDEIQKVPELLDIVHTLMVEKGLWFILSGSSARKLKKSGANTLGGRAIPETFYPLVWPEVTDFQLDRAVQNGMIPRHYMVADATKRLKGYVEVYLNEEIREEGEVRELEAFERFMEVAAISDGEMLNYSNIASDCGVSVKTVQSYFKILYDTLIGYEIPAYRKAVKRKAVTRRFQSESRCGRLTRCLVTANLQLLTRCRTCFPTPYSPLACGVNSTLPVILVPLESTGFSLTGSPCVDSSSSRSLMITSSFSLPTSTSPTHSRPSPT